MYCFPPQHETIISRRQKPGFFIQNLVQKLMTLILCTKSDTIYPKI